MRLDVVLAALAMAAATYLTRAGGYVLFRAVKPGPTLRSALGYIPGALFVAYVLPALAAGGPPEWGGAVAAVLVTLVTRQISAAVLIGTATAWGIWALR